MSDREEFDQWFNSPTRDLFLAVDAAFYSCWQAATASTQAKLEALEAENARMKSVSLEPVGYVYPWSSHAGSIISKIQHKNPDYIPLYTAEQINKMKDKLDTPLMCEVCGNKHTFIYLNHDGTMQIARNALKEG